MSYFLEWIAAVAVTAMLVLLCCPSFALIVLGFLLLAAAAAVLALAAAIVASPYLLARSVRGHWRQRTATKVKRQQ